MSRPNWLEAAENYRRASPAAKKEEDDGLVDRIAAQLQQFVDGSEGRAAKALLEASGRFVRIAENHDGGQHGTVHILNDKGLHQSVEAMGMWTAYARPGSLDPPKLSPATAREVVEAVRREGKSLPDLVDRIRRELDIIASQAPSTR